MFLSEQRGDTNCLGCETTQYCILRTIRFPLCTDQKWGTEICPGCSEAVRQRDRERHVEYICSRRQCPSRLLWQTACSWLLYTRAICTSLAKKDATKDCFDTAYHPGSFCSSRWSPGHSFSFYPRGSLSLHINPCPCKVHGELPLHPPVEMAWATQCTLTNKLNVYSFGLVVLNTMFKPGSWISSLFLIKSCLGRV